MTEEEVIETKKPTRYFLIIGSIVLVGVLLFLLFGRPEKPKGLETVEYSYFTFEEVGGLWQTNIKLDDQVYLAVFRFNPKQVEDVYVAGNFSGFKHEPIYVTFDPDADSEQFKYLALASSELSLHLIRALNQSLVGACTKNATDACIDRPIVQCGDENKSVIYLVSAPPSQITLQGSCVTLNGLGMDLLKSVDRLLYQWYKIMK